MVDATLAAYDSRSGAVLLRTGSESVLPVAPVAATLPQPGTNFRRLGAGVARVTALEASSAFVLVAATLVLLGTSWPLALLLAVVAMETAPATTLMVSNEYDAKGPLSHRLLALVA